GDGQHLVDLHLAARSVEMRVLFHEFYDRVARDGVEERVSDEVAIRIAGADHGSVAEWCAHVDDRVTGLPGPCCPQVHARLGLLWCHVRHLFARRDRCAVEHEEPGHFDSPDRWVILYRSVKYMESSLDAVFGALADPTRRKIAERLAGGPASVSEL